MSVDKQVSKPEWDAYVAAYPRPTQRRTVHWCLPSVTEVADPRISRKWGLGTIAWCRHNEDIRDGANEYFIVGGIKP